MMVINSKVAQCEVCPMSCYCIHPPEVCPVSMIFTSGLDRLEKPKHSEGNLYEA